MTKYTGLKDKYCGICLSQEIKESVKDTFTNLDRLQSQYLCQKCLELFADDFRKVGFYFYKNLKKKLKQNEYESLLFKQKIQFPCLISFSESRKKHRLYRTKTSYDLSKVNLSVDDSDVTFDCRKNSYDCQVFEFLSDIYKNYKVSKTWFKNFPSGAIQQTIGIKKYIEMENLIKPIKESYKFNLIISFLNKDE